MTAARGKGSGWGGGLQHEMEIQKLWDTIAGATRVRMAKKVLEL
ncbi:hypothetical protein ACP70R_030448 [Stipagrostis hirtigluma subsp. patula]